MKQAKILNENTHKYVDVPIVETLGWVVDLGKEFIMKRLFIISLLFLSVGFGQKKFTTSTNIRWINGEMIETIDTTYLKIEYNIENLLVRDDVYVKKFSDEILNGEVFKMFGEMKVPLGNMKDGKKEGKWADWYENGHKKQETTFKDGKPDGLMTGWYPHGQKWREETFKDGQKDGLWIEWHENGQKRLEGNYKDGKQDGLWTYWYENGPKKEEGTWKDGKQDGKHTQWDEKGIKTVIDYDNSICIRTKFGEIVVVLFYDVAPKHVESFKLHVQNGYFDNSIFHRVIPGFVIQGGDPNSKSEDRTMHGMGGHAAKYFGIGNEADSTSWMLPAEFNDSLHTRGILSMARAQDPNSGGSQFFVCVADVPQLDHQYTVFGRVVQGMEFVDMIVNSPRDGRDNPHERVEMTAKMSTKGKVLD